MVNTGCNFSGRLKAFNVDRGFERGDCGQHDPVVGLVIAQLCGRLTTADGGEPGIPGAGGNAQFGHREPS